MRCPVHVLVNVLLCSLILFFKFHEFTDNCYVLVGNIFHKGWPIEHSLDKQPILVPIVLMWLGQSFKSNPVGKRVCNVTAWRVFGMCGMKGTSHWCGGFSVAWRGVLTSVAVCDWRLSWRWEPSFVNAASPCYMLHCAILDVSSNRILGLSPAFRCCLCFILMHCNCVL